MENRRAMHTSRAMHNSIIIILVFIHKMPEKHNRTKQKAQQNKEIV